MWDTNDDPKLDETAGHKTVKLTMKAAKEFAKEHGMKIKKDTVWNDIIVTTQGGSTMHFYNDLEDAMNTMKHIVTTQTIQGANND